jgi:lipoprotein NlpD
MRTLHVLAVLAAALLAGCAARAPAPVQDRKPAPAPAPRPPAAQAVPPAAALAPGLYLVRRGDTLYSIALEHGVDHRDLAQWNRLDDPARIRAGQVLRVAPPEERGAVQVGTARVLGAIEARPIGPGTPAQPSAAPADAAMKTSPKALRLPYSEQNLALLAKSDAAPGAKPAPQPVAAVPRPEPPRVAARDPEIGELAWPARGALLAEFSETRSKDGVGSKGIDIGGKLGDPIVAAAPGKVIYVGSNIQGLGKFIVIKHANEVSTVYAHAREILVKVDQQVARGQRIAELGDTEADRPKLHFQLRKLGKPLDPLQYLPPS